MITVYSSVNTLKSYCAGGVWLICNATLCLGIPKTSHGKNVSFVISMALLELAMVLVDCVCVKPVLVNLVSWMK